MKRLLCIFLCLSFLPTLFLSSCKKEQPAEETPQESENLTVAAAGTPCQFVIGNASSSKLITSRVDTLRKKLKNISGSDVTVSNGAQIANYEILVGDFSRKETLDFAKKVGSSEYAIRVCEDKEAGTARIFLYFTDPTAGMVALDYFLENFISKEECSIPKNFEKQGTGLMITSDIDIRDPFVLLAPDGNYYMYGTNWKVYQNTTGNLATGWTGGMTCVIFPEDDDGDHWAPEVYYYNNSYYMFTTYRSATSGKRGCAVFQADSPWGPFEEISNGIITPNAWSSIDGTLYVDGSGQPWMFFVHEHTSTLDGIGEMAVAKLSADLTQLISEPTVIFRANEPGSSFSFVTDGPFINQAENGALLMLWSNDVDWKYAVAVARCRTGTPDGKWEFDSDLLYSADTFGSYPGGHGMLFTDKNGQTWMAMHSPNNYVEADKRAARAVFVPITEKNYKLKIGYNQ